MRRSGAVFHVKRRGLNTGEMRMSDGPGIGRSAIGLSGGSRVDAFAVPTKGRCST